MNAAKPDEAPVAEAAGLARRLGAMLYDGLLVLALEIAVTAAAVAASAVWHGSAGGTDAAPPPVSGPALQAALVLAAAGFFVYFWSRHGQTLGMQTWRLRVQTPDGALPGPGRALARFALACVSAAALGAGYWWMLFDRERLTWHDRWSGTRVVVLPRTGRAGR